MTDHSRIVFQPQTHHYMQAGINQLVAAIKPTLGPLPRLVAIHRPTRTQTPDLVDSGVTIGRRTEKLANPFADLGAMFIRQAMNRLEEQAGDGTATAAVLLQAVYREGIRFLAAGGNSVLLRHHLNEGMQLILAKLAALACKAEGKAMLQQVAESICHDPPLAKYLGEIFDIIGEYGQLQVRADPGRQLEREYVEGMHWPRGLVSRQLITDQANMRADLEQAAVFISDFELENPDDLMPVLVKIVKAGHKSLLIVSHKISEGVLALLLMNNKPGKLQIIAVRPPGLGAADQVAALEDMAILTGARPLLQAAGQTLANFTVEHLGQARRVWANLGNFGLVAGRGDPRALRQHLATLRAAHERAADPEYRRDLQQRIGKLLGGSATLLVGGPHQVGVDLRKQLAERTAQALRGVVREGVLPGAGASLLACQPLLQEKLARSATAEERAAYMILLKAIQEPARTIIGNAGYDVTRTLAQMKRAETGLGFDVHTGQMVNLAEAGILDSFFAQKLAVYHAVSGAAQALSVDVLLHQQPPAKATSNHQPDHNS
jgi:chaperonin GroEL